MRESRTPPATPCDFHAFDGSSSSPSSSKSSSQRSGLSTKSSSHPLLSSDVESAARKQQALVADLQRMLTNFSVVMDNIEGQLGGIDERKVGEKLKLAVDDIASMLENFGRDIELRGEGGRREMAREAIRRHQDVVQRVAAAKCGGVPASSSSSPPDFVGSGGGGADVGPSADDEQEESSCDLLLELDRDRYSYAAGGDDDDPFLLGSPPDEDSLYDALTMTPTLMTDVSAALRSLTTDEATEITEVAVTVTYIFLAAARATLSTIDVSLIAEKASGNPNAPSRLGSPSSSGGVELLDDEGKALPSSPEKFSAPKHSSHPKLNRLSKRLPLVFWPRLAPLVTSDLPAYVVSSFGPVLSVFMFIVMSPGLMIATFLATPLLCADEILHKTYAFFKTGGRESPRLVQLEQLAYKGYEIGRLYYLISRLAVKQGVRVVKRQTARRGGVKGLVAWGAGKLLDVAMHPLETASWGWGVGVKAVQVTGSVIVAAKEVLRMSG